jgi:ABC-2 type transport system permease protein
VWASARLAIISQLEYRFNLITDALIQPALSSLVEVVIWSAIFGSVASGTINGFAREYYLAYALWAAFFARQAANWMYEFRMIEEIDTGTVNTILARPISFFEYYLAQFMGYKFLTGVLSFVFPIVVCLAIPGPTDLSRWPLAFLLVMYFLVFLYTISFIVASCGFFFNRVHSFTVAKNIALWLVSGELFPLDLIPEPIRGWILVLPFSSGVYVPVGYLTGRIGIDAVWRGFVSITIGLVVFGLIARAVWLAGRRRYSGTGA